MTRARFRSEVLRGAREFLAAAPIAGLIVTTFCRGTEPAPRREAKQLLVSPHSATVKQGEGVQLIVEVVDQYGILMGGVPVTATPNDTRIIVMTPTLAAMARKAGSTEIVIAAGGLTFTLPITVTQVVADVHLVDPPGTLLQLDSIQLHGEVADVVGDPVPGAAVSFSVLDSSIATVSPTGMLKSRGPQGQALVFPSGGVPGNIVGGAAAAINIVPVPTSVSVTPATLSVGQGTSGTLSVTVLDRVGEPIAAAVPTFDPADPNLIHVSAGGVVYSVGGLGQTVLHVRAGALVRDVPVQVVPFTRSAWNVIATLPAPNAWGIAAAPNGTFVVTNLGGAGSRGSWKTLQMTGSLSGMPPARTVQLDAQGATAYVGGTSSEGVRAIDVSSGGASWTTLEDHAAVTDLALAANGATLFASTAYSGAPVYAIDIASHSPAWSIVPDVSPLTHLSLDAPLSRLIGNNEDGVIFVIDVNTQDTLSIRTGGNLGRVLPSPNGTQLYVIRNDRSELQVLGIPSYQVVRALHLDCIAYDMRHSANGSETYIGCLDPAGVLVLDQGATKIRKFVALGGRPRRIAVSPDGTTLLVANLDGWVDILR